MSTTTESEHKPSENSPAGEGLASSDLLSAAMALVGKIKIIHELPEYRAVWQIAHVHGCRYDGPKYDKELETLEREIHAEHRRIFPEEFSSDNS